MGAGASAPRTTPWAPARPAPITCSSANPVPTVPCPALESVVERATWWAEIFETPCVAYARRVSRPSRRSPRRGRNSSRSAMRSGRIRTAPPAAVAAAAESATPGGFGADARRPGSSARRSSRLSADRRRHAAQPDLAYGAYQRGLYNRGVPRGDLRLEKNNDDAAAMTLLGELYNQGLGVPSSPTKAAEWYRLAAPARRRPGARVTRPDGARRARHGEEPGAGPRLARRGRRQGQPRGELQSGAHPAHQRRGGGCRAAPSSCCGWPPTRNCRTRSMLSACCTSRVAASPRDPDRSRLAVRARGAERLSVGDVEYAILLFNGDGVPGTKARRRIISAAPPPRAMPSRKTVSRACWSPDAACRSTRSTPPRGTFSRSDKGFPTLGSTMRCAT